MIHLPRGLPEHSGRLLVLLLLICAVAGCYQTGEEIFAASDARLVPGLEGRYGGDGGGLTIFRVPGTDDYRFIMVPKDNEAPGSGSFRVMDLSPDVKLVQTHLDKDPANLFDFVLDKVTAQGGRVVAIETLEVKGEDAEAQEKALASRFGVTLGKFGALTGPRTGVAQFLLALGRIPLASSGKTFARID